MEVRVRKGQTSSFGFLLPTVILLSLAISIVLLTGSRAVVQSSRTLVNNYHNTLAREAAQSGANTALKCIQSEIYEWTDENPLVPNMKCDGTASGVDYVAKDENYVVTYEVGEVTVSDGRAYATSTGIVKFFNSSGGEIVSRRITEAMKLKVNPASEVEGRVTDIATGLSFGCGISIGGQTYCWGDGRIGQLGNATFLNFSSVPIPITRTSAMGTSAATKVTAGSDQACSIIGGDAYCWGSCGFGQTGTGDHMGNGCFFVTTPKPILTHGGIGSSDVTDVDAGDSHTCFVAAGEAYCAGYNSDGRLGRDPLISILPPIYHLYEDYPKKVLKNSSGLSGKTVTKITAGEHTCAIANGAAYCWGDNYSGRLGTGSSNYQPRPVRTNTGLAGKTVTDISAGANHTCAVANGEAFCWGNNEYGQVGNGSDSPNFSSPFNVSAANPILTGKTVTDISAGEDYTCLVADAKAYCWGRNHSGQLGNGNINSPSEVRVPTLVSGTELNNRQVTKIEANENHTCALAHKYIFCWGRNAENQLGDGTNVDKYTPNKVNDVTIVDGGRTASMITAGNGHTCAVTSAGPFCWGYTYSGQLGEGGGAFSFKPAPVPVLTSGELAGKSVNSMSASEKSLTEAHTCAVANGEAYCWGMNAHGQLGVYGENQYQPRKVINTGVLAGKTVTQVAAGHDYSCALASGKAYCWGKSDDCQLGMGGSCLFTPPEVEPVAVKATTGSALYGKTVTDIDTSFQHTCAVADGKAYCWGQNYSGRLGDGTSIKRSEPVQVLMLSGLLLGKSVQQVTVGEDFSCALADGEVYCWGENGNGQLGNGLTADSSVPVLVLGLSGKTVTNIDAGGHHACAVADGKAYCWGKNDYGQLGDKTTSTRTSPVAVFATESLFGHTVESVSVGDAHTCVIADLKPYCWGRNVSGQLGDTTNNDRHYPEIVFGFDGTPNPEDPVELPLGFGPPVFY